ncbi:hypothetical protein F66182_3591 [Fusarium sp. NRRL 66182]|nr:hypothetical protein F66182_3591 [Fusarium sp. NRRL 66182]
MGAPTLDSDTQLGPLPLPENTESHPETSKCTAAAPIKFAIPEDCRIFSPFARLPPEIRHQIWHNTLDTPGMHFLKVDTDYHSSTGLGRWWIKDSVLINAPLSEDEHDLDPVALEVKRELRPTSKVYGTLKPLYPTPQADISYYTNLNQQLAKLSVTCNESASITRSLTSRPTTFRLNNGRVISLDSSSDVIYLDYVPPDIYEAGFRFSRALSCSGLDQIRNVAAVPKLRFLAQYLPNLEHFYFVDYHILRKSSGAETKTPADDQKPTDDRKAKPPMCRFKGGNRSYYGVEEQDWNVHSRVFQVKSWLREHFVKYSKTSKLSNHKSPEKVEFSVLACEWNVEAPSEPKEPAKPVKKGRNKRTYCEEHSVSRGRKMPLQKGLTSAAESLTPELRSLFPFTFDACSGNKFDFTFVFPT